MVVAVVATLVVAVVAVTKALAVSARLAPVMRRVRAIMVMVESVHRYGSSVALALLARSPQVRVGSSVSAVHVPRPQAKTRDRCAPLHYIII